LTFTVAKGDKQYSPARIAGKSKQINRSLNASNNQSSAHCSTPTASGRALTSNSYGFTIGYIICRFQRLSNTRFIIDLLTF